LARATDAREIAEMSRDLIEQGLTWSWTPARVQHFISGPESSVVVARREQRIAAFAIMHFGDDVAHLNLLAVAPEHRRQGLGSQLMDWLPGPPWKPVYFASISNCARRTTQPESFTGA
jgi:[ribosomal protein S18]-alanine N-acetyltransferase